MTMAERQEIFAKEYLSIQDFVKLYDLTKSHASEMLNAIKRKLTIGQGKELRIDVRGKIHVEDYLEWLGVSSDRYSVHEKKEKEMKL